MSRCSGLLPTDRQNVWRVEFDYPQQPLGYAVTLKEILERMSKDPDFQVLKASRMEWTVSVPSEDGQYLGQWLGAFSRRKDAVPRLCRIWQMNQAKTDFKEEEERLHLLEKEKRERQTLAILNALGTGKNGIGRHRSDTAEPRRALCKPAIQPPAADGFVARRPNRRRPRDERLTVSWLCNETKKDIQPAKRQKLENPKPQCRLGSKLHGMCSASARRKV